MVIFTSNVLLLNRITRNNPQHSPLSAYWFCYALQQITQCVASWSGAALQFGMFIQDCRKHSKVLTAKVYAFSGNTGSFLECSLSNICLLLPSRPRNIIFQWDRSFAVICMIRIYPVQFLEVCLCATLGESQCILWKIYSQKMLVILFAVLFLHAVVVSSYEIFACKIKYELTIQSAIEIHKSVKSCKLFFSWVTFMYLFFNAVNFSLIFVRKPTKLH